MKSYNLFKSPLRLPSILPSQQHYETRTQVFISLCSVARSTNFQTKSFINCSCLLSYRCVPSAPLKQTNQKRPTFAQMAQWNEKYCCHSYLLFLWLKYSCALCLPIFSCLTLCYVIRYLRVKDFNRLACRVKISLYCKTFVFKISKCIVKG